MPGFLYISEAAPLSLLTKFMAERAGAKDISDMELISKFKDAYGQAHIDYLPVLIPFYAKEHVLVDLPGKVFEDAPLYAPYWYSKVSEVQDSLKE
ncbi:MAG: hypothetical protein KGJ02_05220 [Verrucomicrobiota bacterium]|nr:hypothetical protein [Verrucomicrobiota bacterium]